MGLNWLEYKVAINIALAYPLTNTLNNKICARQHDTTPPPPTRSKQCK